MTVTEALRRGGVLGDVGQRLGDDEVDGQLDLLGERLRGHLLHLDRQRSAVSERLDRRPRPPSDSTLGWIPRTSSRISLSASSSS